MKPTKRHTDPLGRSTTRHRYSRYLLSLAVAITGSVWPIQARSIEAIFDTLPASRERGQATRWPSSLWRTTHDATAIIDGARIAITQRARQQ